MRDKPTFENADFYYCNFCDNQTNEPFKKCLLCSEEMIAVHSILLIDENSGCYIPNKFYNNFDLSIYNVKKEDYPELENPEHEQYYDAWDELLEKAYYIDEHKNRWTLEQSCDLFLRLTIEQ